MSNSYKKEHLSFQEQNPLKETLRKKKLFLLDMDGTLYIDDSLFDGAREFLEFVRTSGGKYVFLTNNSSKGVESYISKMKKLGIDSQSEDYLTSVDCLIFFLKERYGKEAFAKSFYIMGTASFLRQMSDEGFNVVGRGFTEPESIIEEKIDSVILGFDRELTFQKLEDVCKLLNRNVDYFATNPDWVCPTSYGSVPDCGSFASMIEKATGKLPYFIGKPEPHMPNMAMKKFGFSKEETVIIGDRLYTDIACGNNAGVDTILVLSGESTLEDIKPGSAVPKAVCKDIKEVLLTLI